MSRHWSDFLNGITYGLILFIFGNYTHTLNWITLAAFYPSLIGYALIAELPFARTSFPNIKHWPKGMWVIFITALVIILVFAGYHIYLGSLLPSPFLWCYIASLGIPISILVSSFALSKEVNSNWCRTTLSRWRRTTSDENARLLLDNDEQQQEGVVIIPNPYTRQISIHLHHWQIFYVLAFFTRFDDAVSQVGAGIVLACYMEGICAYGYDALVNDS
ncbi:hypothetical protein BD770DRAFT_415925 [Pilaira anomala]|nr:hypothetical protein BD770DRAFT_415925 [Pilaira anomala]